MYLIRSDERHVIVPGFLLGYKGEAMMPEFSWYMKTLPYFLLANVITCAMAAYALAVGGDRSVLPAFSLFMAVFAAKMFSQRLVRVSFKGSLETAARAPLLVRLNVCFVASSLVLMGNGFIDLQDDLDTAFFKAFGGAMICLAAIWILALFRCHRARR